MSYSPLHSKTCSIGGLFSFSPKRPTSTSVNRASFPTSSMIITFCPKFKPIKDTYSTVPATVEEAPLLLRPKIVTDLASRKQRAKTQPPANMAPRKHPINQTNTKINANSPDNLYDSGSMLTKVKKRKEHPTVLTINPKKIRSSNMYSTPPRSYKLPNNGVDTLLTPEESSNDTDVQSPSKLPTQHASRWTPINAPRIGELAGARRIKRTRRARTVDLSNSESEPEENSDRTDMQFAGDQLQSSNSKDTVFRLLGITKEMLEEVVPDSVSEVIDIERLEPVSEAEEELESSKIDTLLKENRALAIDGPLYQQRINNDSCLYLENRRERTPSFKIPRLRKNPEVPDVRAIYETLWSGFVDHMDME